MSIFAKPSKENTVEENQYGVKILFLHGLEGAPTGSKATHLKQKWGALCPAIRTTNMVELRSDLSGKWENASQDMIDEAIQEAYRDALDAVKYSDPDIIVGSSLGAALLYKLYANAHFSGSGVFLAPAIPHLVSEAETLSGANALKDTCSVWVLGELDTIVPNKRNAEISKASGGNLIYSPEDSHRLSKALEAGLIDAAILTAIEGLGA